MGLVLNIIKGFFKAWHEAYFMIDVCVRLLVSVLLLSTMFSNAQVIQDVDMLRFRTVFILFFIVFMYWSFYPMIEKFVNIKGDKNV